MTFCRIRQITCNVLRTGNQFVGLFYANKRFSSVEESAAGNSSTVAYDCLRFSDLSCDRTCNTTEMTTVEDLCGRTIHGGIIIDVIPGPQQFVHQPRPQGTNPSSN